MRKCILSVNENKAMNFLLQTIFERDYVFFSANNVFEGMHYIKKIKNIDSIIVDLDYNQNQSWELIEHIKSSRLYNLPMILLCTHNTDILQKKSYELGVDEVFFKPFNPLDLVAALRGMTYKANLASSTKL